MNGDDKANVIWYNTSPCPVVYWLLNGLTIMSQVFSGTVSMDGASPVDQASEPRHLQTSPQNRPYLPTVGQTYNRSIGIAWGTPPFTCSAFSGSLPPTLTLNPSIGQITGIPITAGNFLATIRVQDSGRPSQSAQELFSLTIHVPSSLLQRAAEEKWAQFTFPASLPL